MRSSPPEAHDALDPLRSPLLRDLHGLYNDAFGALRSGELERVDDLVRQAEVLTRHLTAIVSEGGNLAATEADLHRHVQESHGRLTAAMESARAALAEELGRVRKGKKGLSAYGGRATPSGQQVHRQA